MGIEDWKEKRRDKALNKVNKELDDLKKKGLEFENQPKKKEKEVKVIQNKCSTLKILSIILAIGWIVTFFVFAGRVSNLKSDVESMELEVQLAAKEAQDLSGSLENVSIELEQKRKGEDELGEEVDDLLDLREELEEEISDLGKEVVDLKEQIDDLEVEVTIQENLVESYKDCITDEDDGLNTSLDVCDEFL